MPPLLEPELAPELEPPLLEPEEPEAPDDVELAAELDPDPPLLEPVLAPEDEPELPLEAPSSDASRETEPGIRGSEPSSSGPRAPHPAATTNDATTKAARTKIGFFERIRSTAGALIVVPS